MWDEFSPVCWDRDSIFPGGRMIPCGDRTDVHGWGGGAGFCCPLGQTLYSRSKGRGGFRFKLRNNKRRILGL